MIQNRKRWGKKTGREKIPAHEFCCLLPNREVTVGFSLILLCKFFLYLWRLLEGRNKITPAKGLVKVNRVSIPSQAHKLWCNTALSANVWRPWIPVFIVWTRTQLTIPAKQQKSGLLTSVSPTQEHHKGTAFINNTDLTPEICPNSHNKDLFYYFSFSLMTLESTFFTHVSAS